MKDDDVDLRLKEYAARWRGAQPAPPEPVVEQGGGQRPWLVAAAAAAAVVLVAVGVGVGVNATRNNGAPSGHGVDFSGAIPWIDAPYQLDSREMTAYTIPTTLQSASQCRLGDLQIRAGDGAAAGTAYGFIMMRNISDSPCEVRGIPTVELLDDNGAVVQSNRPPTYGPFVRPVVLVPGSWARADLGAVASDTCGGLQSSTMRFTIPGTGTSTIRYPQGGPLDTRDCPGAVDRGHYPGHMHVHAVAPISLREAFGRLGFEAPRTEHITAPATVRAGTTLRYVVSLTPEQQQILLLGPPCWVYAQGLRGAGSTSLFRLNCSVLEKQSLHVTRKPGPDETGPAARFEMRLPVAADTPPGHYTLTWQFTEPHGPVLTAPVEVTSP